MTPGAARGSLLVATAAVCWGAQPTLTKLLFVANLGPVELAAIRAPLACALLGAGLGALSPGRLKVPPRDLPPLALFGCLGIAIVNYAYFLNLTYNTVPTAVLLTQTAPVLVAPMSAVWFRERVPARLWLAAAASLAGAFVMAGGVEGIRLNPAGVAVGLFTALMYATFIVLGKQVLGRNDSWTVLFYALLFASLFWIAVAPSAYRATVAMPPVAWLGVLAMATVATVLPFGLSLKGLALVTPTAAAVLMAIEPVAGISIAGLVLGEPVRASEALGGAVVLAAVLFAQTARR